MEMRCICIGAAWEKMKSGLIRTISIGCINFNTSFDCNPRCESGQINVYQLNSFDLEPCDL